MIDILYRKDIADLLKIEIHEQFGNGFEALIRNILSCYNYHSIVIKVYLPSKPWRNRKKGSGVAFRYGLSKPGVPEIHIGLHNYHQMLLTLFHELEHLRRPPMVCFSKEQRQREEQLVERKAKAMCYTYSTLHHMRLLEVNNVRDKG